MGFKAVFGLGALAWSSIGPAQAAAQEAALSPDEQEVYAVVEALFDGMREKDAEALSSLFTDEARLNTTGIGPDGTTRFGSTPITGFIEGVSSAPAYLDEKIWDPEVVISDALATVWVKYALYVDEAFSHCGVDAFQLFKSADGWKIFQLTDTRRREDCWEPPA